ncbi:MAG TPA: hypothetical protein VFU61_07720 [Steroidobacteraceae bacterium]|nr:hypothetical protein [Steroidobacteraceae bacterium]
MTRTTMIAAGLLLCAGALPVAHADCGPAPQPAFAIPDGAHASRDEMSAARDNLSDYSAQVAAYASCLDAEDAGSGRTAGSDARRLQSENLNRGSQALLRLASIMSCFSRQVEAFHVTGGGNDAGPAECSRPQQRRSADGFHAAPGQPR